MADLEYNMSYDLSRIMQELGDSDTISSPMTSTLISQVVRTEQMETDSPWYLERTEDILEKDASGWTTEELEFVGEALNESWNNKDHETAEKILNAFQNAEESQIPLLMCCESIQQNGELYYTMNRLNLYSAGFMESTDGSTVYISFHIEKMDGNTQITIRQTTEDGTDRQTERELAKITAIDLGTTVNRDSLRQKGYTEAEIQNFLLSAITDEDTFLAARLSEGNYRQAYATDYQKLSGCMVYQISYYQTVLAERLEEEEFLAETEKQINVLFDNTYADGTEKTYAYGEYLTLIRSGLEQQDALYDRLKETGNYSEKERLAQTRLEALGGLWRTFENYYTGKNTGEETITLLPSINNNTCSLRIQNLRKDELNRYCYEAGLVYNETGEEVPENIVTVDVEKVLAAYKPEGNREEHIGHLLLDVGGMLPIAGMMFDALNAVWYLYEGNSGNALMSMISFIPGVGDIFGAGKTGVKTAARIGRYTDEAIEIAQFAGRCGDETVEISAEVLEEMMESTLKGGSEVVDEVIEGGLDASIKNIDEFIGGNKLFDDVLDDYAKVYADKINSNQAWSWDDTIPGGENLTKSKEVLLNNRL